MPEPILGERMCACVILRHNGTLTSQQLVAVLMNPEILHDFVLSLFGKVPQRDLTERIAVKFKQRGRSNVSQTSRD